MAKFRYSSANLNKTLKCCWFNNECTKRFKQKRIKKREWLSKSCQRKASSLDSKSPLGKWYRKSPRNWLSSNWRTIILLFWKKLHFHTILRRRIKMHIYVCCLICCYTSTLSSLKAYSSCWSDYLQGKEPFWRTLWKFKCLKTPGVLGCLANLKSTIWKLKSSLQMLISGWTSKMSKAEKQRKE